MPTKTPISAPLRDAIHECFAAITRLVRPELRRQLVLVGGAASIAHSSGFRTEDVDVAAPPEVLIDIWEGVSSGALNFTFESDGKIAFDAPQGFRLHVNIIAIGEGCVERIHATEPLHSGSVASVSDLLLLRAVTVVDRGGDGDVLDFQWLLSEVAGSQVDRFPEIDDQELEVLLHAVESCLGEAGCLVVAAIIGSNNAALALRLLPQM